MRAVRETQNSPAVTNEINFIVRLTQSSPQTLPRHCSHLELHKLLKTTWRFINEVTKIKLRIFVSNNISRML